MHLEVPSGIYIGSEYNSDLTETCELGLCFTISNYESNEFALNLVLKLM
jgi:hypothetical protein